MGKELERTAYIEFGRQELEDVLLGSREFGVSWWRCLSLDEGCGELLVQRVWKLASARPAQCSSFIGAGELFLVGFRPISDEVGAMPWESEGDWNGEIRAGMTHVEVAIKSCQVLGQLSVG